VANIVVKSAKFGIVVKELNTRNYKDETLLINDILQAIPDADWFEGEEKDGNSGVRRYGK
jgi:hypothetical protein